jgi:hypothetical protein
LRFNSPAIGVERAERFIHQQQIGLLALSCLLVGGRAVVEMTGYRASIWWNRDDRRARRCVHWPHRPSLLRLAILSIGFERGKLLPCGSHDAKDRLLEWCEAANDLVLYGIHFFGQAVYFYRKPYRQYLKL